MNLRILSSLGLLAILALAVVRDGSAQQPSSCPAPADGQAEVVYVRGAVPQALELSARELEGLRRERVRVVERDGSTAEYEGVALADVLMLAGMDMGSLRGPQVATVVVAEARDGYRAVYALAELDASFSDRRVVLVDRKNGNALTDQEGPFRIIMDGESRHSRWIRQVTCLRVERL